MADGGPAGYYVGRPMSQDEQQRPPPRQQPAADEQVNAQVPGYYAGRVPGKKPAAAGAPAPPADKADESGSCAKWFACFTGGGKAR